MPVILAVFCVALMLALASCGGSSSPAGDTVDTTVFQGIWDHEGGGERMVFSGNNWRNYYGGSPYWNPENRGTFTATASRIYFIATEMWNSGWEVIPPQDREQLGAYYSFHSGNARLQLTEVPYLYFLEGFWDRQ